ncbi:RluA family pseudouridine synthase [Coxiella endosymbiont of Amblyomma nuttalli]|uniref:RluA family pseudouridine synthase n=1 Tax=Coxiella endosymbiont of Amblyomma nuttalli TaxID=2749996 RepID=UPI001BACB70D|nr:RluA family pseudouridine synthase [Coxiella endosymbiont of Amblyomma nuttalli]QTS84108.1 Ribosomal large subunit pseudouridine synthase C [Coxiella endosymbiont of Amblyomma nuttalli]
MSVTLIKINKAHAWQRLDNFLIGQLRSVPKTRIYRAIRNGEVRVNKRRVHADYRLLIGDIVRMPPVQKVEGRVLSILDQSLLLTLEMRILCEDSDLLVINKPSGLPVHGGNRVVQPGLIEALRVMRPGARMVELVHRLDQETSGCLVVAKKRSTLIALHALLIKRKINKQYFLLVKGHWQGGKRRLEVPLQKNILQSGERIVKVSQNGKSAITFFRPLKFFSNSTLLEARPLTGRTHQIRVHAAYMGHPIAGDEKYGDKSFNREMRKLGLCRLFLHSAGIYCKWENKSLGVCVILDIDLINFLKIFNATDSTSID